MAASTSVFAREEIQQAIAGLPKRQHEALDLLELEHLPYAQIAARMGTSDSSVAQLISRARINLYDELRGTPLASVAAPSPQCERSLPLIAAREDGQLDPVDGEATWLDAHLAGCERCRPAVEQMAEAAAAYRAWAVPEAPGSASAPPPAPRGTGSRRRTTILIATSLALVLLAGLAAALLQDGGAPAPTDSAAEVAAPATGGGQSSRRAKAADAAGSKGGARKKSKPERGKANAAAGKGAAGDASADEPAPTSVIDPVPSAAGGGAPSEQASGPSRSSGEMAVNPPKQVSTSKPSSNSKPAPSATLTPEPSPAPSSTAPPPEPSPPSEEAADRPGRSGEAPGKPTDRPPR